jgi:WD40 repeat protein
MLDDPGASDSNGGQDGPDGRKRPGRRRAGQNTAAWIGVFGAIAAAVVGAVLAAVLSGGTSAKPPGPSGAPSASAPATTSPAVTPAASPGTAPRQVAAFADPHSGGIRGLAVSYDYQYLAAADGNGHLYLWATPADTLTATLADPGVSSVAFAPAGQLATGDSHGHVYLWTHGHHGRPLPHRAAGAISAVTFTPNSQYLAAATSTGTTFIFEISTRAVVATMHDPASSGAAGVSFSADYKYLATADGNGHAYLWATPADTLGVTLRDPGITAIAFAAAGQLATGDSHGHVYLWTHQHHRLLPHPPDGGIESVAITPDSKYLAAAAGGGASYLWKLASGSLTATIRDPAGAAVSALCTTPNSEYLVTGDTGGQVTFYLLPAA